MSTSLPAAKTVFPWLKANLGKQCLGVLTGTDYRALAAAVQIMELYAYDGDPSNAQAFGLIVRRMQPSARELAFHAIAHVLDWHNRSEVWAAAGLAPFERVRICAFGPGGKGG